MTTCGIYALKPIDTDQLYLGYSHNLISRFYSHKTNLLNGIAAHKVQALFKQNHSFEWIPLVEESYESSSKLCRLEKVLISYFMNTSPRMLLNKVNYRYSVSILKDNDEKQLFIKLVSIICQITYKR